MKNHEESQITTFTNYIQPSHFSWALGLEARVGSSIFRVLHWFKRLHDLHLAELKAKQQYVHNCLHHDGCQQVQQSQVRKENESNNASGLVGAKLGDKASRRDRANSGGTQHHVGDC